MPNSLMINGVDSAERKALKWGGSWITFKNAFGTTYTFGLQVVFGSRPIEQIFANLQDKGWCFEGGPRTGYVGTNTVLQIASSLDFGSVNILYDHKDEEKSRQMAKDTPQNIYECVDSWLIEASTDTIMSLIDAVIKAGGTPAVVNNSLDKPFREVLASLFVRNNIRFTYVGSPEEH